MSFSTVKWRAVTPLQDGIGKALLMMWTIPLVLGFETALANNAAGLDGSKRRQAETFLPIHEWYPSACCMDIDCGPISARGVRKTPLGWHLLDTGEIIGFSDRRIRKSLDLEFHRCVYEFWLQNSPTRCLFIPGPGIQETAPKKLGFNT